MILAFEKSRFVALALPWRTCASLRPNHRSPDCLFKIILWKHPNSNVWDLVLCNKLFLILWQYPCQIVSMPLATRNLVLQHYHCSKITLALYSWDVIILIHYFGCLGVNLPFGESRFAISSLQCRHMSVSAYQITDNLTVNFMACLIWEQKGHHISALLGLRDCNHWLLDSLLKNIAWLTTNKTPKPSHGWRYHLGLFIYIYIEREVCFFVSYPRGMAFSDGLFKERFCGP